MVRVGILTSGGDSPGMNAAVRAVARGSLNQGAQVIAIHEGYQGMVDGGPRLRPLEWDDTGGILQLGGTILGTARCQAFRERPGRLTAAENLVKAGLDRLIVVGGDGSLSGAQVLHEEWSGLLDELVSLGRLEAELAARHPWLTVVGLPGSIDNDLWGTDISIGADTALHRIVSAADAIFSTASSHQRTFIIEVMGRNCGYLALMGAMAIGAEWALIPEAPPSADSWRDDMCAALRAGRLAGRRASIVILAEGARDSRGEPITSHEVQSVLQDRLGEDVRITILGHVQRGGSPSAFDRVLSSVLGYQAAMLATAANGRESPVLLGLRGHQVQSVPLTEAISRSREVTSTLQAGDYTRALELRGASVAEAWKTVQTTVRAASPIEVQSSALKVGILTAGGPAPGMNMAVRVAVRLLNAQGHRAVGVKRGYRGLLESDLEELDWMSISGWAPRGGSELGCGRLTLSGHDFYAIARTIESQGLGALLVIGGISGYEAAFALQQQRKSFPVFDLPIVCLPASIDNNLPGSELSLGADTALNNIVEVIDKIKQSAVASQRCFVVEVMGQHCGYLALTAALATGAEKVYLPEEGITAAGLLQDLEDLCAGFRAGKRLALVIRNEQANPLYTTQFIQALFEEEGGDLFDVRQAILGHIQQGGSPSPFDRLLAVRLVGRAIEALTERRSVLVGLQGGLVVETDLADFDRVTELRTRRPREQWWLKLRELTRRLGSQPLASAPG